MKKIKSNEELQYNNRMQKLGTNKIQQSDNASLKADNGDKITRLLELTNEEKVEIKMEVNKYERNEITVNRKEETVKHTQKQTGDCFNF